MGQVFLNASCPSSMFASLSPSPPPTPQPHTHTHSQTHHTSHPHPQAKQDAVSRVFSTLKELEQYVDTYMQSVDECSGALTDRSPLSSAGGSAERKRKRPSGST